MIHRNSFLAVAYMAMACSAVAGSAPGEEATSASPAVSFSREVAPLLQEHCLACHNPRKAEGGYRVDTYAALSAAGDSGLAPLQATDGDPAELLRRVTSLEEAERMPAETSALDAASVEVLTRWVEAGAAFDGAAAETPLTQLIPPPTHPPPPEHYPSSLPVTALAFSADGQQLYSSGYHEVLVWNLDGTCAGRIGNLGERVYALAVSPRGDLLAVACGQPGREGELRLVALQGETAPSVSSVPLRLDDVVLDVAFSPSGDLLACACADKTIRLLDVAKGEVTMVLQSHAEQVTAVCFSGDGTRLASASRDGSAKVFDAVSGQLLVSYQGHAAAVRGVAMLADGSQVFSAGDDKKLHRWSVADAKKTAEVSLGQGGFEVVAAADAVWVASADAQLRRIALADNAAEAFGGHSDWILSTAASREGGHVASGSHDGEIRLWTTAGSPAAAWQAKP